MSMYGPPGGPYPGQPQDPWQGGQPGDPYGQPADPYGAPYGQQPDPWAQPGPQTPYGQPQQPGYGGGYPPPYGQASAPPYGQPASPYQQPGYPGQDMWGQPIIAPPPQKKGGGAAVLIAVIVVLAVLVCAGGGTALYFITRKSDTPVAGGTSTPTARTPSPTATTRSPTPSPVETDGAKSAKQGDCLANDGTETSPKFRKTSCSAGTFLVLKRFEGALSKKSDGTIDTSRCDSVPGYVYPSAYSYWFDHPVDSNDFLLCLKKN